MPDQQDPYLIPEQIATLLAPIKEHRVGRDKKGLSHVEAYEIRAHLNRIFGFARWSADTVAMELLDEKFGTRTKDGKTADVVTVGYRAQVRLTVCAPDGTTLATYTEWATGDAPNFPAAQWPDAHDFAIKTAESQAFKRCAMNLGDQFGLSLYRKGSLEPLVKVTLVNGQGGAAENHGGDRVQDAAPVTYRHPDPAPSPTPEPPEAGATPPAPASGAKTPDQYREMLRNAPDKAAVRHAMMELETAGLGEAEVGDNNGVAVTLRDLAATMLKALKR